MKRFLSLVLSLVMVMSLVTVSAGAKDFTDNDAITYGEAVAVVSEVGIVDGYADGEFKPTNTLTRQAAAKIICNLILGPTTAAELHADTAPYPDVPVTSEFAGYIAFCQSRKIISGYGDGTFKPGNTLTGYAFMKMLLGALGYDATLEGYTGANWSINVAKQALHIGLDDALETKEGAVFNGLKAVTREEACLYAFNTLQADLVEYNQRVTTNVNGTEITLSSGGAESRKWTSQQSRNDNIIRDDIIQFAEEYFNKLVRRDDYTKFMEPANLWLYDKVEIGTFERLDLLTETYTGEVTGRDLYDLLKAGVIADNDLEVYIDGVDALGTGTVTFGGDTYNEFAKTNLVRSNTKALGATGDGVLTKVYVDTDRDLITVASRHTWLAKASADYSESREYAPLAMYINAANNTRTYNVDVEDVPAVADVTKDTFYQVNVSWKDTGISGTGEIAVIKDVEILEDSTVTKFSAGDNGSGAGLVTKLTTGGTEYKANVKAFYDKDVLDTYNETLLTNNTYNVFLDSNGFFIGVELFEGTKNYVFVTGFDRNSSNLSVKTATACGIFLDGTMKNFQVNVTDTDKNIGKATGHNAAHFIKWSTPGYSTATSDWGLAGKYGRDGIYDLNQWYTYTEDDNGTYTLKPCVRMTATRYQTGDPISDTIRTDALSVVDDLMKPANNRVYGEDETIFLTVDLDVVDTTNGVQKAITEVTGVYTGVQNVDIDVDVTDAQAIAERQVFTVYDSDYYVIGAVVIGEARGATANYAYITSLAKSEELRDGTYYWEFDAVVGGEHQTLTARSKFHSTIEALTKDTIQELRFDGDYVVAIKDVAASKFYTDYTNEIQDAQEIYALRDELSGANANDDPDTLTLQGRTLYVTNGRTDVGLALASDCKAVTIQVENGSNKKTNFGDVASAIDHLADEYPTVEGVQYDGKIYAVLNSNKTAQWVVFVNDVELKTGSSTGGTGTGSGALYTYNAWVDTFGFAHATVDYKRPDWVLANDDVAVSFDVYADGKLVDVVPATNMGAGVNRYSAYGQSLGTGAAVPNSTTITLENVKFTPKTVNVQYKVNGKVLTPAQVTAQLGSATATVCTAAHGTQNGTVTFTPAATAFKTGTQYTYTINNVSATPNNTPTLSGTVNVGTANTAITAGHIVADGDDYVVVEITATPVDVTYTSGKSTTFDTTYAALANAVKQTGASAAKMSAFGVNGAANDDLKIEWSKASGIAKGESISFTATATVGTDNLAYNVVLETSAGNIAFTDLDGTAQTKWLTDVKQNVEITKVTVTVAAKKLAKLAATDVSISADGYEMTITYNTGVCKTAADTAVDADCFDAASGDNVKPISVTHTAGTATMTLRFATALADSNTVKTLNTILNAAGTTDKVTPQTITVAKNATTGAYSVTVADT